MEHNPSFKLSLVRNPSFKLFGYNIRLLVCSIVGIRTLRLFSDSEGTKSDLEFLGPKSDPSSAATFLTSMHLFSYISWYEIRPFLRRYFLSFYTSFRSHVEVRNPTFEKGRISYLNPKHSPTNLSTKSDQYCSRRSDSVPLFLKSRVQNPTNTAPEGRILFRFFQIRGTKSDLYFPVARR